MVKSLIAGLYVILVIILVLSIHELSPTDMAGPGFDLVVYFLAVVIAIVLFANGLKKLEKGNRGSYVFLVINAIGLALVFLSVYRELHK